MNKKIYLVGMTCVIGVLGYQSLQDEQFSEAVDTVEPVESQASDINANNRLDTFAKGNASVSPSVIDIEGFGSGANANDKSETSNGVSPRSLSAESTNTEPARLTLETQLDAIEVEVQQELFTKSEEHRRQEAIANQALAALQADYGEVEIQNEISPESRAQLVQQALDLAARARALGQN